jgi:hypothetical protein
MINDKINVCSTFIYDFLIPLKDSGSVALLLPRPHDLRLCQLSAYYFNIILSAEICRPHVRFYQLSYNE